MITGPFEVNLTPITDDKLEAGRMLIEKTYSGELAGTGLGQMLSSRSSTESSGAYVAIEQFTGSINGREGSFVLQHTGSMNRGADSLTVVVIPDSGTGELAGLSGSMEINIAEGKHFYVFNYTIESDK